MNPISKDISLKHLNTFAVDVKAAYYGSFNTIAALDSLLNEYERLNTKESPEDLLILGGGSNILFAKDFEGVILKNEINGISLQKQEGGSVWVKAGAGIIWHDFVNYCIDNGFAGVENLSLIPGTVGAAPIQNIGAYGVEVKDVIESVECLEIESRKIIVLSNQDCQFDYRSSIFKKESKKKYIILSVLFRLSTNAHLHLDYGVIKDELLKIGINRPSIRDVSNTVIKIRRSKLPDPSLLGNAGSFFKNPFVAEHQFIKLKKEFPDIVSYKTGEGYKLAAGWLIEKAGWKGFRNGQVGVHDKQALVLVNYGNASGKDIVELSERIQKSVFDIFGVVLETEVNILN